MKSIIFMYSLGSITISHLDLSTKWDLSTIFPSLLAPYPTVTIVTKETAIGVQLKHDTSNS